MKYILKNIKSFAKDYTKIFVLLIITISASTLIIHLSYGMFREYKDRSELSKSVTNRIDLKLKSSYSKRIGSDTSGTFETMGDLNSQIYDRTDDVRDVTVQDAPELLPSSSPRRQCAAPRQTAGQRQQTAPRFSPAACSRPASTWAAG